MLILQEMHEQLNQIISRINDLEVALKTYPEGSLQIGSTQNYQKFYHYVKGKRIYLKKGSPLILDLARKKCLQFELKQLKAVLTATDLYVRHAPSREDDIMSFIRRNQALCDILKEAPSVSDLSLAEWVLNELPSEKKIVPFPENRIHKMKSGHVVRSKTEGLIDSGLFDAGIPFRYEDTLTLVTGEVFPDFTIRHPLTGKYYYWEHFGLMDDPGYAESAARKILNYIMSGYLPGHDLIMTFEKKDCPLPYSEITRTIEHYFLK